MECLVLSDKYVGDFDFVRKIRKGRAILFEKGNEFTIEYDENGNQIPRTKKRTFEGIKIMISKKITFFYFF